MKQTLLTLCLIVFALPSWGEALTIDDLVQRNDLYYKKFSNVPFTGEISGMINGKFKNGEEDGEWVTYWNNGNLYNKGEYKYGKREEEWVGYFNNGQLKYKGEYKNHKRVGEWVEYWSNGHLWRKGEYNKNGIKVGEWVVYKYDGTLQSKETY